MINFSSKSSLNDEFIGIVSSVTILIMINYVNLFLLSNLASIIQANEVSICNRLK